jgi:hypothetical protein
MQHRWHVIQPNRVLAIVALAVTSLVGAACGSSGPTLGSLSGLTAQQALQLALHNARQAKTLSFTVKTQATGFQQSVQGDAGPAGGDVTVTSPAGVLRIIVVGGMGYVESDVGGLEAALGLSSTAAGAGADKWIAIPPASPHYADLTRATSLDSTLGEFTPGGTLELTDTNIAGRSVGLIEGIGTATVKVQSYQVQMAVSTQKPILPIGGGVTVKANGNTSMQAAVFSLWGRTLNLSAPAGAIPLASISST